MSGLTPGVTLRKTFISESSPKATEELDCSPLKRVEWTVRSSSWPSTRWKASRSRVTRPSVTSAKARSHRPIDSRSWTAS